MLGLSRGYPHILYLSLSKWDAAPIVPLFHKAAFCGSGRSKIRWHAGAVPPWICHCFDFFRGLPDHGPKFPSRSRQHLGPGRSPSLQVRNRKISSVQQRLLLKGGTHGYVDILENFPGRDPLRAVGGFHKIVASLPAMFTSERIPELQGTGELPGSNQKSRPIDLPIAFYFPHFVPPLGEGLLLGVWFSAKTQLSGLDFL